MALLLVVALADVPGARSVPSSPRGLPLTRFYALEEIGNVSTSAQLGFDPLGRLAVIQANVYDVLNDTTWFDLADKENGAEAMLQVVFEAGSQGYYGGKGTWGTVEFTRRGILRARPMVPPKYPKWARSTNFTSIVRTESGVCFAGSNGAVYWDRGTRTQTLFDVPEISRVFAVGEQIFISSPSRGLVYVDARERMLRRCAADNGEGMLPDQAAPLDGGRSLVSNRAGRLMIFDGGKFSAWSGPLARGENGRITALERLADGDMAIAIAGKGLFVTSATGEILFSLTAPEYRRIRQVAAREAGVLWIALENGLEKVFYDSPLGTFDRRLGLPIGSPQVARWRGQTIVASGGRLYEAKPGSRGGEKRFELVPDQPQSDIWTIAASGERMLVGNSDGVFSCDPDARFRPVLAGFDVSRLVMISPELCFVLGTREIGVLQWSNGGWHESAGRVAGVGYPAVTHASKRSAWVELGANRAARISLQDDRLWVQVFEDFPWKGRQWVSIGIVDDIAVLSGVSNGRLFYDERTNSFTAAPALREMLERAPYWVSRMVKDDNGIIWASYQQGLLDIRSDAKGYQFEPFVFDIGSGQFPIVQLLEGHDVWLSTGQSLFHVDREAPRHVPTAFQPTLVSVIDARTGADLFGSESSAVDLAQLDYAVNSLGFRFFSGTYRWWQAPIYEFRLSHGSTTSTTLRTGYTVILPNLEEGSYRLEVRLNMAGNVSNRPLSVAFTIAPPWYRTWYAYAAYLVALGGSILGLIAWLMRRAHARHDFLEDLVRQRTGELKATMQKLNEETRNAATLAERGRLAADIHDSLQQGLTGIMLQLESTLKLPEITDNVHSQLSVAKNMVSYTRHEVQNAIGDMRSSLLQGAGLEDALRKIATTIGPGAVEFKIAVEGQSFPLPAATNHHLFRIAQEAVTNAIRHAAPKTVTISLRYGANTVELTVADDGAGFVPDEVQSNAFGHFGLRGLRTRVEKMGGELRIESAPGRGTSLTVAVPRESHEHS